MRPPRAARILHLPPSQPRNKPIAEQPITPAEAINPQSNKEEPSTWYSEKDRISITHIQTPRDDTTEYMMREAEQDYQIMVVALVALLLFLAGAFF